MYKEHYPFFSSVCLNLTDACNLECKYCFVKQCNHYMTYEIAEQSVDFLMNNVKQKEELTGIKQDPSITYFGGEPTIMWDSIIVPLTKHIREKYGDTITLTMTTNGTLLDKERIDFMRKYDIYPHLSFDGPKEVQDKNRPMRNGQSSYEAAASNISYLLQNFPNTTMRATIDQATVDGTFNSYVFAMEHGFRNFFTMPNGRETWSEENIQKLDEEVEKIFALMYLQFSEGHKPFTSFSRIDKTYEDILNRDLQFYHNRFNNVSIHREPFRCGLGTTSASISYDGRIYACQEQDSYGNSFFFIGDIWNGVDRKKHEALLDEYTKEAINECEKPELCKVCPLRQVCQTNGCPSSNYDTYEDFFINPEVACRWNQILFKHAINMMRCLVEENNLVFKDYLDNECHYKNYYRKEEKQ